mmetsp:Transcript_2129/g.2230  ORF Transcript_2129/g.2230 Transcript_2129/m.2230 type:complete len:85 (+) Transcript_2129:972-1226(+)
MRCGGRVPIVQQTSDQRTSESCGGMRKEPFHSEEAPPSKNIRCGGKRKKEPKGSGRVKLKAKREGHQTETNATLKIETWREERQ